ncbi:MAG: type II toxin-antitoxin system HicA family toxin [Chloroflexi bacterium]|nr:type II toxin-antitoxin system HicA family toxin [Chloroflexota bacterium]
MGYEVIRQRGSHIRLRKTGALGEHNITVVAHKVLAKGTLNDILDRVSLWNAVPKDDLVKRLK